MTWNPGGSLPLPPPPTLPYAAPPQRSDSRAAILLAWLVIIGVVIYVGVENWRSSHDQKMERAVTGIEMEISSRSVVGYVAFMRELGISAQLEQKVPELTSSVTSSASSVKLELMAVAVVGELQGKAAALAKLDAVDAKLKSAKDDDTPELRQDAALLRTIYSKSPRELSVVDQARIETRLGWFGKLALVAGLADADPERSVVLRACKRAAAAAVSAELFLLGLLVVGIVLMIIGIYKLAKGTLFLNYKPAPYAGSAFIEMFALYLLGFVVIGQSARAMHVKSELMLYGIVSIWIAGCCCWPMVRGLSFREIRKGLGWTTCRGVLTEATMGLVGYIAFLPMLGLAIILSTILGKIGKEHAIHPIIFEAGNQSKSAILGLYLLASGFAPVVEETMFRGALFHHLRRTHRWLLSAALSAFIFAAIHPQGWSLIPVLGGIGFAFAGIREWRGNIIASGTAHAINNAFAMTMMFLILG